MGAFKSFFGFGTDSANDLYKIPALNPPEAYPPVISPVENTPFKQKKAINYPKITTLLFQHEGGYVNDPKDPGGATNRGITIGTYSDWLGRKATINEVKAMPKETADAIYKKNYWDKIRADDLPIGVDAAVFDFGVNSGPARAVRYLQSIVGTPADGIMGPKTIAACDKYEPAYIINKLCDNRLNFLKGLNTWDRFKNGWTSRVEAVRKQALELAAQA